MTDQTSMDLYFRAGTTTCTQQPPREARLCDTADDDAEATETARLSAQCREILRLLREGPQTNVALAEVARKYTGRISDLRRAGHNVVCTHLDRSTGVSVYTLKPGPPTENRRPRLSCPWCHSVVVSVEGLADHIGASHAAGAAALVDALR